MLFQHSSVCLEIFFGVGVSMLLWTLSNLRPTLLQLFGQGKACWTCYSPVLPFLFLDISPWKLCLHSVLPPPLPPHCHGAASELRAFLRNTAMRLPRSQLSHSHLWPPAPHSFCSPFSALWLADPSLPTAFLAMFCLFLGLPASVNP